jgi:hypothetical protein
MLETTRAAIGWRGWLGLASRRSLPGMHVARRIEQSKGSLHIHFRTPAVPGYNLIALPQILAYANGTLRVTPDAFQIFNLDLPASPSRAFQLARADGFVIGYLDLPATLVFSGEVGDLRPELLARTGLRALLMGGQVDYHQRMRKPTTS